MGANEATYYRQNGNLPCGFQATQVMVIDCPNGNRTYSADTVAFQILETTVASTRSNVTVSKTWGPPATATIQKRFAAILAVVQILFSNLTTTP